jgi:hypothetical protein
MPFCSLLVGFYYSQKGPKIKKRFMIKEIFVIIFLFLWVLYGELVLDFFLLWIFRIDPELVRKWKRPIFRNDILIEKKLKKL